LTILHPTPYASKKLLLAKCVHKYDVEKVKKFCVLILAIFELFRIKKTQGGEPPPPPPPQP